MYRKPLNEKLFIKNIFKKPQNKLYNIYLLNNY